MEQDPQDKRSCACACERERKTAISKPGLAFPAGSPEAE